MEEVTMRVFWLALLTACLWGIAPIFEKIGLGTATPLAAMTVRSIVVIVGLGAFLLITGAWREVNTLDARSIFYLALGGLTAGLLGTLVYLNALKLGDAARVVPIAATFPLVAATLAIIFLREPITPGKIIGALLIVLGVIAIRLDQILWPSR